MVNIGKEFKEKDEDEFWADKVRRLKSEERFDEVLSICKNKLPFPAAFREVAFVLRRKIRIARKSNTP